MNQSREVTDTVKNSVDINKVGNVEKKSIVIGLTGGIGCGKSTVSIILKDKGAVIIDADIISRQITNKGTQTLKDIEEAFGSEVIDEEGNLIRKKLGSIVFSDSEKLKVLNAITHKYIIEEVLQQVQVNIKLEKKYIVIDCALLFQMKLDEKCDIICGVYCSRQTQMERIVKRNNLTLQEAENRINSQVLAEEIVAKCDYKIKNEGTLEELDKEIESFLKSLYI